MKARTPFECLSCLSPTLEAMFSLRIGLDGNRYLGDLKKEKRAMVSELKIQVQPYNSLDAINPHNEVVPVIQR